jgi:hypothetical protein
VRLRSKPEPASAAEPPAEVAEPSAEERRAENLMSFAGGSLCAEDRAAIARLFKEALAERRDSLPPDDSEALAETVTAASDELARPRAEVARALAEAQRLEAVWEQWRADHDLALVPAGDRRRRAAETLEAIDRRRARLEERLRLRTTVGAVRQRAIVQLEQLDREESEHWAVVHPPFCLLDEDEPEPPRCRCGREISRADAYRIGLCELCAASYELLHGSKPPTIG